MKQLKFITPRDGDMLSDAAGTVRDGRLELEALVLAPEGEHVTVNGVPGRWCGGCYRVPIALDGYANTLTAVCGAQQAQAVVYWLPNADGKFSLSVDDNIWFLADLTRNQDVYTSIFDNLYLHVYKLAHEKYGVKVRLNLFYEMDNPCGIDLYGKFDLSMMTEKFREEFRANAHWLRFAFHSRTEWPEGQYTHADGVKMTAEYEAAAREIIRFAGAEALEPVTTIHCGEGNPETVRALRQCGVRALMGLFTMNAENKPRVSYYLDENQVLRMADYGLWKDHETDMIFGKIEVVLNEQPIADNLTVLETGYIEYPKKRFVECMIHEQYFYPTYRRHLPDFVDRIFTACRWAADKGYTPAFLSEILAEEP